MKVLILLLLCTSTAHSQIYLGLDGSFFKKDPIRFGGAADLHFGGYSKAFNAGIGTGLYFFGTEDPYIPIFFEAGYLNNEKKISPYLNGRFGYTMVNGGIGVLTPGRAMKAMIFSSVRAGAGIKMNKFDLVLFGGLLLLNLKDRINYAGPKYSVSIFNIGFSLVGFRR